MPKVKKCAESTKKVGCIACMYSRCKIDEDGKEQLACCYFYGRPRALTTAQWLDTDCFLWTYDGITCGIDPVIADMKTCDNYCLET